MGFGGDFDDEWVHIIVFKWYKKKEDAWEYIKFINQLINDISVNYQVYVRKTADLTPKNGGYEVYGRYSIAWKVDEDKEW